MRLKNLAGTLATLLFLLSQSALTQTGQTRPAPQKDNPAGSTEQKVKQDQEQTEGPHQGPSTAAETAKRFRRSLPVIPSLVRGSDGLLTLNGQRATQNLLVTSTNAKEPTIDAFPFAGATPVEASEPVQIPDEQFGI